MKRTLIMTGSDINLKEVLSLTLDSKINYTKKHNYDLLIKTNWNNVSKYHFKDFEAQFQDNSQPYLKVLGFLRVLYAFEMLRDYDNVMWIDADAIITNSNYTIQDITTEEHCFFVSHDWAWTKSFNTGNFIIKRHKDTQALYETFLEVSKHFLSDPCQEQATLNYIYQSNIYLQNVIKVLPWKYLNSVPEWAQTTETWKDRSKIAEPWTEESFIAHLTGLTNEERIHILTSNILKLK